MKKIKQFQITSLMLSGFKSYEEPTELVFGNPTVITGGNGRGKSSIADAIAFAVTGCPFFGERTKQARSMSSIAPAGKTA